MSDEKAGLESLLSQRRSAPLERPVKDAAGKLFDALHTHFPGAQIGPNIRYALVFVDDPKAQTLYVAGAWGFQKDKYGHVFPMRASLSGKVILSGDYEFYPQITDDTAFHELEPAEMALALPLRGDQGNIFGAVVLEGPKGERGRFVLAGEEERFRAEVVPRLEKIADLGGVALDYFAQANRDPVTDLLSRRRLEKVLASEYEQALIRKYPYTIVMVDLDNFGRFNEARGHLEGDKALRVAADVISNQFRERPVGRYGGEEFVVVSDGPLETVLAQAETCRYELERQSRSAGLNGGITASYGVASELPHQNGDYLKSAMGVLDRADGSLYIAKGKDVWRYDKGVWRPERRGEKKNRVACQPGDLKGIPKSRLRFSPKERPDSASLTEIPEGTPVYALVRKRTF